MSLELLYDCLGIEKFLGTAKYAEQKRHAHMTAVLTEQMLQEQNDTCDIEQLSKVSMMGSEWSKTRAWMLAAHYSAVLID